MMHLRLHLQQPEIITCSTVRNTFKADTSLEPPVITVAHAILFVGLALALTISPPRLDKLMITHDFNS